MPFRYVRKTTRGASKSALENAMIEYQRGASIRSAAKKFRVDRMTLKRFITKKQNNPSDNIGYANCKTSNMIFSPSMEADFADHIKNLGRRYHGLSKDKCRKLAYEFAVKNDIKISQKWLDEEKASQDFWLGFRHRNNLTIRAPEATSLARASAFNAHTVGAFFDNLGGVLDRNHFEAKDIFNVDETGCTTVQKPKNVVSEKGVKQVGAISSAERGELVTVINTISASGTVLPPMFVFPRVKYKEHFLRGAPHGSVGAATRTGWINEEIFLKYLLHFIKETRCSNEKPVLLIMDNHEAHISIKTIDLAKENGITILTIPPHTSHRLQPLDRAVYGPYKKAYYQAIDAWLRSNPGKTLTIYDVPELVREAQVTSCVPRNVLSGFQSCGIYPFNRNIFSESDFLPAAVTDRDFPRVTNHVIEAQTGSAAAVNFATVALQTHNHDTNENAVFPEQEDHTMLSESNAESPEHNASLAKSSYVSPQELMPLPKAGPRKTTNRGRKRGSTRIITDTPVRNEIAVATAIKNKRKSKPKRAKSLFVKRKKAKKIESSSSDSDSDVNMELLSDNNDSEISDDEIVAAEGDFVIVKVLKKSQFVHYVARIDNINEADYEGVFLRRVARRNYESGFTFEINTNDETSWAKSDVITRLPFPTIVGTSKKDLYQFSDDHYLHITSIQ